MNIFISSLVIAVLTSFNVHAYLGEMPSKREPKPIKVMVSCNEEGAAMAEEMQKRGYEVIINCQDEMIEAQKKAAEEKQKKNK